MKEKEITVFRLSAQVCFFSWPNSYIFGPVYSLVTLLHVWNRTSCEIVVKNFAITNHMHHFENDNFRYSIYFVYFRVSSKRIALAHLKSLVFTSLQGDIPFPCSLSPWQLLTFTKAPTVLVTNSYVSAKSSCILLNCEQTADTVL